MWDLIHDRTHMRGDLPFDPFMIKQRMPFFLYSLEELRCDLTAFRESVKLERSCALEPASSRDAAAMLDHAKLVQYAVIFDRIFRFADHRHPGAQLRRPRRPAAVRVAAPAPRAALDRHPALHRLGRGARGRVALGDAIEELYWRSIDRPKTAHWLAAYELVSATLTPHPASVWAQGLRPAARRAAEGLTDAVLDDEFPLSMFYEALARR